MSKSKLQRIAMISQFDASQENFTQPLVVTVETFRRSESSAASPPSQSSPVQLAADQIFSQILLQSKTVTQHLCRVQSVFHNVTPMKYEISRVLSVINSAF